MVGCEQKEDVFQETGINVSELCQVKICSGFNTNLYCILFLLDPVFVKIQKIPDSTEKNDDKLYFFFREKSLDAAGGSTPSVLARVGRVCLVRT